MNDADFEIIKKACEDWASNNDWTEYAGYERIKPYLTPNIIGYLIKMAEIGRKQNREQEMQDRIIKLERKNAELQTRQEILGTMLDEIKKTKKRWFL